MMDVSPNDVTEMELIEMCKIVTNQNAKQALLVQLADKLCRDNFSSLDGRLKQDIREMFPQIYSKNISNLFERIFQTPHTTKDVQDKMINPLSPLSYQDDKTIDEEMSTGEEMQEPMSLSQNQSCDFTDQYANDETPTASQPGQVGRTRFPIDLHTDEGVQEERVELLSLRQKQGQHLVSGKELAPEENQVVRKRAFTDQHASDETPEASELGPTTSKHKPSKLFNIIVISDKHIFNDKFKCRTAETIFKFHNIPQDIRKLSSYMHKAFDEILSFITKDSLPHDKILMKITISKFNATKPICINLITVSELKSDVIISRLESIAQSNSCFLITDALEISSVIVKIPHGKIRTSPKSVATNEFLKRKAKSLIVVELYDPIYCLPTAILLGKCLADNDTNKLRVYMAHDSNTLLEEITKLKTLADVKTDAQFADNVILQLAAYQRALPHYNIVVYHDRLNYKSKLFNNSNNTMGEKGRINIFYFEDISHFVAIRDVRLFFGKKFECEKCSELYDLNQHECLKSSKLCAPPDCSELLNTIDSGHNCYVQKYKENPPTKFLIIFYELVCTQHSDIQSDSYRDEPNLCAALMVCDKCFMILKSDYCCSVCDNRQHIFENNDKGKCIEQFIDFCELLHEKDIPVFCITHNFKAYDGQFLLRELVKRDKDIQQIMSGMVIYKIIYDSYIHFIDSLNFLPVPLSKFPDTFDLENVATGWYPKFFNTSQNYNYIEGEPNKTYFGTNHMLSNESNQFNSSTGLVYDNRIELIKYCIQDVDILRGGCIRHMTNFLNHSNINPLLQAVTLSQAVMLAFRKKFMQENTLSIVHPNLYHHFSKNQSITKWRWLIFENQKSKYEIMHVVNLPSTKYSVDGYCKLTNTVYEFLECYRRGCEQCFLNRTQPLNGDLKDTFNFRYEQTCSKLDGIKSLGYKIISTWECKFKDVLLEVPEFHDSIKYNVELLDPSDALYDSRRSDIFRAYYKAKDGEKIRYYDFASVYAFVNKTGKFPIGHPKIYDEIECKNLDIQNMDGLIKCSVLPPHDLRLPILPFKINNEILFPLCRTCAEKQTQVGTKTKCSHSDKERMFIGTWVLDEIKLSVNHGYKICNICEVWEYEIAQYDIQEKTGGIFTEYIDYFIKLKQEASGWPANITSEIERDDFLKEFSSREGIELDASAIKNNEYQRDYRQLVLDALWDRNDVCDQTITIQNVSELYALVSSAGAVITDLISIEDVLWISWKHSAEDFSQQFKRLPFAVDAFATANVRIKLYNELTKISENIIYCDTDSVIFVEDDKNKSVLKTGNFTGDLINAISEYGENAYITEITCTGPKSYTYTIFDPDNNEFFETAKYKGITLNLEANKFPTRDSIVDNRDHDEFQVDDNMRIKRKKY